MRSPFSELLRLAVPLALVQMAYQATAFVDTAFAGRIDELSLAATGLGASILFAFACLGLGIGLGMDPLTSQRHGAGDEAGARAILWQGVLLACAVSLPIAGVVAGAVQGLEAIGIDAALAERTRAYVMARLPGILPLYIAVNLRAFLQASHRTRPIVLAAVLTNVVNAVGNAVLVFPDAAFGWVGLRAPFASLGVEGLGWASVLALATQASVLAIAVGRLPTRRPCVAEMARVLRVGLPVGLHLMAEVGLFSATQVLMAGIAVVAGAAHQVALMLAALSFSISLGVGAATSVQVGRAIGQGDTRRTRQAGLYGVSMSAAVMATSALCMWLFPTQLAGLLTTDPRVIARAVPLLHIAAIFQLVDGLQAVASGALRGAGITRWTFVAHLIAHWGVGLPLGVGLAFGLGLGPEGLWWGLTAGLTVAAVATAAKFLHASRHPIARL